MNWTKILIGLVVIVAVVVFYYRWLRHMRGGSGSGLVLNVSKRKRGAGPNDLETFIAARRAAQQIGASESSGLASSPSDAEQPTETHQPGDHDGDNVSAKTPVPAIDSTQRSPAPAASMNIKPKGSLTGNLGPAVLLSPELKLLYLICRTAMPAHHIFAKIGVSEVLPVLSDQADLRAATFDIVACRADMTVLAVANLSNRGDPAVQERIASALAAAKVRFVLVNPSEMPRPQELREKLAGNQ